MNTKDEINSEKLISSQPNHSGLSAVIHPLALLNITDHFTRIKVQSTSQWDQYKVIGILLGSQSGRKITISNSFELKININCPNETTQNLSVIIDEPYLESKQDHLRQIFPDLDAIGWYSFGSYPTILECELQQKYIQTRIDSPLYLQFQVQNLINENIEFHPTLNNRTDLPLVIYEPFYDGNKNIFIEIPDYYVETDFIQRMALAAMVQAKGAHETCSSPTIPGETKCQDELDSPSLNQLARQRSTVSILSSRLSTLIEYIETVQNGELTPDHNILREIACLLNNLPHLQEEATKSLTTSVLLYQEYNDVLLGNYLSSLTRGVSQLSDLVSSLQVSREYNKRHMVPPSDQLFPSSSRNRLRHHN